MMPRVKSVILFFGLVVSVALAGCTIAEQDASGVGDQFQNGISGRGKIVPLDTTSDSFGSDYR